jgi:hypothetical protein
LPEHGWDHAALVQRGACPFQVASEEQRAGQRRGDNLGIAHGATAIFVPLHRFEHIVNNDENSGALIYHDQQLTAAVRQTNI